MLVRVFSPLFLNFLFGWQTLSYSNFAGNGLNLDLNGAPQIKLGLKSASSLGNSAKIQNVQFKIGKN